MPAIGDIVKDLSIFKDVHSILEFGSNDGDTYKIVKPTFYLGIDWKPKWMGEEPHARVVHVDLRDWWETTRKFDLVICDAHGAADDPQMKQMTYVQLDHARYCVSPGGLIAFDDCWLTEVARPALKELGQPIEIAVERPGFWIWRR